MTKKKRSFLQKVIVLSIFFNISGVLSNATSADLELYNKYKQMLKRFATTLGQDVPKAELQKFLQSLNIFENLQLKELHPENVQSVPNLENDNKKSPIEIPIQEIPPEYFVEETTKNPPDSRIEQLELSSLSQESQNYGNPAASINQNYALPSQNYAFPSQSYALPSQSYASPSIYNQIRQGYANQVAPSSINQNYAAAAQNYATSSQNYGSQVQSSPSLSYGAVPLSGSQNYASLIQNYANQGLLSNLNQNYAKPSLSYGSVPLSSSPNYASLIQNYANQDLLSNLNENDALLQGYGFQNMPSNLNQYYHDGLPYSVAQTNSLAKYLGYSKDNLGGSQNPIDRYNPNSFTDVVYNNNGLNADLNQNDVGNLQNIKRTLIDISNIESLSKTPENPPVMDQEIYEGGNILNDPSNIPLGIVSLNENNDPDYTPVMSQNPLYMPEDTKNQAIASKTNEKEEDSSLYSFLNENPELYEKLLKNNNFMTGLMNRLVLKIAETKKDRIKKFRNKLTVKRLVPKGQVMTGPVYDEKYRLLYIPLMKVPRDGREPINPVSGVSDVNTKIQYQIDPKPKKDHAYLMESTKLRQSDVSPDVYDPPIPAETSDVLPPFHGDEGPNGPGSYTKYIPDYSFTDWWTYEKPLLQDDCPDYAINVAGVCIKYPPFRKFLH